MAERKEPPKPGSDPSEEPAVPDSVTPDSETPEPDAEVPAAQPTPEPVDPTEESPMVEPEEEPTDPSPPDEVPAMQFAGTDREAERDAGANIDLTGEHDLAVETQMTRMSRRSFLLGGVAAATTVGAFVWIDHSPRSDLTARPLRAVLNNNERVAEALFNPARLLPEFGPERITATRTNEYIGVNLDLAVEDYTLQVTPQKGTPTQDGFDEFTLADVKQLPHREMITELHCIEGWTIIQKWTGARFSDFVKTYTRYHGVADMPKYTGMGTGDGAYYVGLDTASAMHQQTLLCWAMNDKPLEPEHGAPLRLIIPVKYGVKNIKQVATIDFTDKKPADYWAEQGYDWYCGF